jgi:Family of unknown function (DUF5701)
MPPTAELAARLPLADPHAELDRQVGVLGELGLAVPSSADLHGQVGALAGRSFAVVVPDLAPADELVALTEIAGRHGFTTMAADDLARFRPTQDVEVPDAAYLLVDPDPGRDWRDVPPAEVLPPMLASGRTPLTLDEGLALLLQDGRLLRSATCFSMLASRCGDKRVPALWVSKNRPRLGWCWNGAPHSWLGSASAAARLG